MPRKIGCFPGRNGHEPGVAWSQATGRKSIRQLFGLSPEETTFLLEAAEHYCATRCPLRCGEGSCPMLTCRESVHSGAVERVCKTTRAPWRERFGRTEAIRPPSHCGKAWA